MRIFILEDRWKIRLEQLLPYFPLAVVARDAATAFQRLPLTDWDLALLDHDLEMAPGHQSGDPTGYDVAAWTVGHRPKIKLIVIHSTSGRAARMAEVLIGAGYCTERMPFEPALLPYLASGARFEERL